MLCSLPVRAQVPIVAGVNRMFAALSTSAASARVIQSAAGLGTAQSGAAEPDGFAVAASDVAPFGGLVAVELSAEVEAALSSEVAAGFDSAAFGGSSPALVAAFRVAAELRSFFAQPEPLKWIVGGVNALRSVEAPQRGHRSGPDSFTPWTTSNRWPQVEHT
jgi:hypothetical protein